MIWPFVIKCASFPLAIFFFLKWVLYYRTSSSLFWLLFAVPFYFQQICIFEYKVCLL